VLLKLLTGEPIESRDGIQAAALEGEVKADGNRFESDSVNLEGVRRPSEAVWKDGVHIVNHIVEALAVLLQIDSWIAVLSKRNCSDCGKAE
jgi:hypothetical protein